MGTVGMNMWTEEPHSVQDGHRGTQMICVESFLWLDRCKALQRKGACCTATHVAIRCAS